jgi:hypothetical protein
LTERATVRVAWDGRLWPATLELCTAAGPVGLGVAVYADGPPWLLDALRRLGYRVRPAAEGREGVRGG